MKRTAYIFIALLAALFILESCDKVDEPYTELVDSVKKGGDENYDSTKRVVLLEDYTGHRCVNCPTAAHDAHIKQMAMGKNLVIITIHAGYFAEPTNSLPEDFRCTTGNELDEYYGVSLVGNPNGLINRTAFNDNLILGPGSWNDAINTEYEKPKMAKIRMNAELSGDKVSGNVQVEAIEPLSGDYKICVYVVEDSIVAPQENNNEEIGPTPHWEDYVHRHVLRGSVNGTWGSNIISGSLAVGNKESYSFSDYVLDPEWNKEQIHLVAILYHLESKEVIEAWQMHLE
jgi:hypothetical protein